jgi:hypothetical protein
VKTVTLIVVDPFDFTTLDELCFTTELIIKNFNFNFGILQDVLCVCHGFYSYDLVEKHHPPGDINSDRLTSPSLSHSLRVPNFINDKFISIRSPH